MQALNIAAEFRAAFPNRVIAPTEARLIAWADNKVQFDGWVKDDGDYYTAEEWREQYEADELQEMQDAEDNFRSWLDETEPDTDCHCGHPECGAC